MSKCGRCRYYCRTGSAFLFSHIGLCGLVFGYTVMGAFTFVSLEAEHETNKKHQMRREEEMVVESLWSLTVSGEVLNETRWTENATATLRHFETELVQAMRKDGYDGNYDVENLQWTFSGALLYSIIVITTIGYGNIAPKTDTGKIVTILYAIVGIPLLLLCLSNIGDAMAHSFKFIYWKACCYLCSGPKTSHHKRARSNRSSRYPSEARTIARDIDPMGGRMYGGYSDSFDRQRSYASDSLPRHQSYYASREAEVADAYRVPIISNKYALHPMETADLPQHPLQRYSNTIDSCRGPIVRPPTSGSRHPDSFLNDELSFEVVSNASSTSKENEEEASVPIMLCISIVVGYICGGAILFSSWEGWDYSDSCYFCFITLTTIGFGDMVPGTAVLSEDAQLALGLCSMYLLFGMALLAMSFNLVQEEVKKMVTTIGKRIGILSEDDDDDDDI
ncbi:hypothetical protein JTE90_022894 [Oedothorax gibbosus]|uniref:Potassium channel domain-containing protein n=1 Tax=Oedothorax gibbosus TaxID=931172 RepID=A0AAV6UW54_9ARAC|nr:hypothetical protein JTE90_022894 [Oedothorax gibbosus]